MKKIQNKTKLIKRIEDEFNNSIELILLDLYVTKNLTLDEIRIKLRIENKNKVIELLNQAGIYSHVLSSLDSII